MLKGYIQKDFGNDWLKTWRAKPPLGGSALRARFFYNLGKKEEKKKKKRKKDSEFFSYKILTIFSENVFKWIKWIAQVD